MQIAVIGVGKLGLCTAVCLADAGYQVIGMDNREDHIEKLRSGRRPFFEKDLDDYFQRNRTAMRFTASLSEAIMESDASFIVVPTPSGGDGAFSHRFIHQILKDASAILRAKASYHVVNIVSTVMPGACNDEFIPLLEKKSDKRVGEDIGLTYNPEFIAIGSVIRDFLNPDVVLIGESDKKSGGIIEAVYRRTSRNQPHIARTSLINAEIAKLSINCFCTMKISFANNLGEICDKTGGADAGRICEIIGHDSRIGGKYIKPGLGFGGPCFPRDNEAFLHFLEQVGGTPVLQGAVVDINQRQVGIAVGKIARAAGEYGKCVALLGMAYKPDTYLCERSQSVDIARRLAHERPDLDLRVYDPMAVCNGNWTTAESLDACVDGAHVAAILTPWPEFYDRNWRFLMSVNRTVLDFWA
ncbi:MAG: nucleotide sugar dehydrogenase [Desulfuromusa sp.]|nr:nucleotide sugar dehydrogenase [Desulfuromusa sp.]